MKELYQKSKLRSFGYWILGCAAFIWLLLRSGLNPKRLTYPCQRAAMPLAVNWLLAILAFAGGSAFLKKFAKFSAAPVLIAGVVWFTGVVPYMTRATTADITSLPLWEVENPVSTVFVMDSIPYTPGSLAPGDTTVPDAYLSDPAIDSLLMSMGSRGIYIHRTSGHPDGIVGSDNVVIIKGNFQWTSYNTTSTDRIKGLVWKILQHPDGFSGEIIICDNTQEIGTGINEGDNNSEDTEQSIVDVVNTFYSKGYNVYLKEWVDFWDDVAGEYSAGDYSDGFVYDGISKISYPKFRSPSGDYYISLRYGVWDSLSGIYDSDRLCIIDFPVLKAHGMAGSTIAVKNWIGVLTTAYASQRYGGWDAMHYNYLFGSYALVAKVMAATYPRLTIVDATWTTTRGPANLSWVEETRMIAASTDPTAVSWYTAKFILTPIAWDPANTNPDEPGSDYHQNLNAWTSYLSNTAGYPCTIDSSKISVYDVRGATESPVSIEMVPDDAPIIIPPGASFTFTGILENNTAYSLTGDVWIMLRLPGGMLFGPIRQFNDIPLNPYQNITISGITQAVPLYAPYGPYSYIAYAGFYPSVVIDSASFPFDVIVPPLENGETEWSLSGWFDRDNEIIPVHSIQSGSYPNPFNSSTEIWFILQDDSHVKLNIYNIRGQVMETLVDDNLDAGQYNITWDAAEYPTGVYFYKLFMGENTNSDRIVLIK